MASNNDRVIPALPRPRTSPEAPKPKVPPQRTARITREQLDRMIEIASQSEPYLIGYGGIQAHGCF